MGQVTDLDLDLPSGRLYARWYGSPAGRLVLCLPGLSANLVSLEPMAERLAAADLAAVSLDLRGRGLSETTAPGTYGWVNHAQDVLRAAEALGAASFDLVGWSMGAFVAMQVAELAAARLGRVALIDAVGRVEAGALELVRASAERLEATYPSVEDYLQLVRSTNLITPWSELWERYFRYELERTPGGVRPRTSRQAVLEDLAYGEAHDPGRLWTALTMPVLLVRALRPSAPALGFVVSEAERDRFLGAVPGARLVEVDANHYGVVVHPRTLEAVVQFLATRGTMGR